MKTYGEKTLHLRNFSLILDLYCSSILQNGFLEYNLYLNEPFLDLQSSPTAAEL
jgi:hypothetical protein